MGERDRETEWERERQRDRVRERQPDRQTDRQRYKHMIDTALVDMTQLRALTHQADVNFVSPRNGCAVHIIANDVHLFALNRIVPQFLEKKTRQNKLIPIIVPRRGFKWKK